jgi:hypothetical protein
MTYRQAVAVLLADPLDAAAQAAAQDVVRELDEETIAHLANAICDGRPALALVKSAND